MAKKRAKVSDQAAELGGAKVNSDLFAATSRPQSKVDRPNRIMRRATYDMTPELKTAVIQRAKRWGISASQLAMFLLCDGLRRYDAGEIDPKPYLEESDSPKFRNNLAMGDWYTFEGDNE